MVPADDGQSELLFGSQIILISESLDGVSVAVGRPMAQRRQRASAAVALIALTRRSRRHVLRNVLVLKSMESCVPAQG